MRDFLGSRSTVSLRREAIRAIERGWRHRRAPARGVGQRQRPRWLAPPAHVRLSERRKRGRSRQGRTVNPAVPSREARVSPGARGERGDGGQRVAGLGPAHCLVQEGGQCVRRVRAPPVPKAHGALHDEEIRGTARDRERGRDAQEAVAARSPDAIPHPAHAAAIGPLAAAACPRRPPPSGDACCGRPLITRHLAGLTAHWRRRGPDGRPKASTERGAFPGGGTIPASGAGDRLARPRLAHVALGPRAILCGGERSATQSHRRISAEP